MVVVSVGLTFSYSVDIWIVNRFLGTTSAASYSIANRLYQLAVVLITAGAPALWVHYIQQAGQLAYAPGRRSELP